VHLKIFAFLTASLFLLSLGNICRRNKVADCPGHPHPTNIFGFPSFLRAALSPSQTNAATVEILELCSFLVIHFLFLQNAKKRHHDISGLRFGLAGITER
jgi:hypothetical protein